MLFKYHDVIKLEEQPEIFHIKTVCDTYYIPFTKWIERQSSFPVLMVLQLRIKAWEAKSLKITSPYFGDLRSIPCHLDASVLYITIKYPMSV